MKKEIIIGSRKSELAVRQAEMVRCAIHAQTPHTPVEIITFQTSGDAYLAGNLSEIGNKGLFTKEIEQALLDGIIDIAVHSMKDVATTLPDGLIIPAMLPRDDVRDTLIIAPHIAGAIISAPPMREGANGISHPGDKNYLVAQDANDVSNGCSADSLSHWERAGVRAKIATSEISVQAGDVAASSEPSPAGRGQGEGVVRLGGIIAQLPQNATLGTSSLRRAVQVKHLRPDINVVNYRGNVQRRLAKLEEGVVDATLLAQAGLDRLGISHPLAYPISINEMLPAVAQGAIGIQCRAMDFSIIELLENINHDATHSCVSVERHTLKLLDGSCRTPIAAYATLYNCIIRLRGMIASHDASWLKSHQASAPRHQGRQLAEDMAKFLQT